MEASPLTQQNRPTSFQPKIVQLYDDLLRTNDEETTFSDGFWREFFILKPDRLRLQQRLERLSPNDLLHLQVLIGSLLKPCGADGEPLQHETQQLFIKAIADVHDGVSPMDEHALDVRLFLNPSIPSVTLTDQTLTVFLEAVLSKNYTNPSSDSITVIAGLNEVDAVMSDFANAIEHCIRNGKAGKSVSPKHDPIY